MHRRIRKRELSMCRQFACEQTLDNWINAVLYPRVSFEKTHTSGSIDCLDIDTFSESLLLSGSSNGRIAVHDTSLATDYMIPITGHVPRNQGHKRKVTRLQWYPLDSGMFSSSSLDASVKVWDASNLECVCTFELEGPVLFHSTSASSSHALIASTVYSKIVFCDLATGSCSHSLSGHKRAVTQVEWLGNNQLVSSSLDGSIRLWDIRKANSCLTESVVDISDGAGIVGLSIIDSICVAIRENRVEIMMNDGGKFISIGESYFPRDRLNHSHVTVSTSNQRNALLFLPIAKRLELLRIKAQKFETVAELTPHFSELKSVCVKHRTQEIFTGGADGEILGHVRIHNTEEEDVVDDWD